MSNRTTFSVTHTIAYCPCAMERGNVTAVSGTGVAKSRSMLRAVQRAKRLAEQSLSASLRRVRAQGEEPAQTPVLDDGHVSRNGQYIGAWDPFAHRLVA